MRDEEQMSSYQKKVKMRIPKSLNLVKAWEIMGPVVAQEIGGPDYIPIPYCYDTNAYKIGHIFVKTASQTKCFRAVPVLKVLGPIRDFVTKAETNVKWLDKNFYSIKTSGDKVDFQVVATHGKNSMTFKGYNYYFLSKAPDMPVERNVTINRSSHEDLSTANWFGLITSVVVAKIFEFHIVKDKRTRTVHIGDSPHTVIFKYEICEIDSKGTVTKAIIKKIPCKWQPLDEPNLDSLPLAKFPR